MFKIEHKTTKIHDYKSEEGFALSKLYVDNYFLI